MSQESKWIAAQLDASAALVNAVAKLSVISVRTPELHERYTELVLQMAVASNKLKEDAHDFFTAMGT